MVSLEAGTYRPIWKNRRRVIFLSLTFCAVMVGYIAGFGGDTRVNETIVVASFAQAGVVILGYVFGATIDDNNYMKLLGGLKK